ncbi:centrosomal protein of 192 kDa isoform X2 [Stegastes partitus]|uniref:Centrosomal protein of 192 kDa isoform X2 n=1 Tax=Stegastes partitus TaxID=144197 RepID=A0A9Y4NAC6_9TELE|nr:PREDICTED: centrosomal protein of 192 kDa isoform X2 [Stegastes partitus]
MADSFYKLEDEAFPSFLCKSLDSTSGRATLGNVTLGSGPGLPVAASTVAKIRPGSDNRGDLVEASYLEGRELQPTNPQLSVGEQPKFALSFKDDLDNADDFIAAHRFSDMLVKINLDESASKNQSSMLGLLPTQTNSVYGRPTDLGTDLSTGLLTFAQFGHKDSTDTKAPVLPAAAEDNHVQSDGVDSDHFSGSNSSFLANEKLMSVDSMNSDITDDDIDLNNLPDDELELYFNKLVPPAMQRGRVEGQEIPATEVPGAVDDRSNPSSAEPEQYRHQFLDQYDQEDFQMPDVRLAATGMDSCPASDEDTEDELESARRSSNAARTRLLPSMSRQLVGESNRPSFRPGLEGGSSDDEGSSGHGGPFLSGIEHRRSAEGQVINPPVTGDGGGGDGSSGSEESGNDGGVSTIPLPATNIQTTYDALRGLGIVGSSAAGEDEDGDLNNLPGHGRNSLPRHTEMGDRVGPVGTGEASSSLGASGGSQRLSPVNWSMVLERQEVLDAMESTDSGPTVDRLLDSVYLRSGTGGRRLQDSANLTTSHLQGTQGSFHLSQVLLPGCDDKDDDDDDDGVDEPDGARSSLGLRGGPCGDVTAAEASDTTSEDDNNPLSTSLEPKYFSQSFYQEQEDSDDGWNHCPDNLELEFQQGAKATHGVVYQNENGQWVTDLAYYSSFEKELNGKTLENASQFQTEDFVSASDAIEKIVKDQEEFEKEHQFMQEEKIDPASSNSTFHSDSSWKLPANGHILMRTSQVSSEFKQGDESYLRLSFGQFFEQRSEALGCLGTNDDVDVVKRPSFGYIITSPEKREPFALIHPSEFRDNSPHSETMELSEADKTLNPEDLDKTLEAPAERMSPKGDTDPAPCEQEDQTVSATLPDHSEGSGSESTLANQSCVSPDNNTSQLMLSISTISSAIANASISTDPSQLAAMIMELSKKSRVRNRPESARLVGPTSTEQVLSEPNKGTIVDTLHRSTCVGEMSAFDMEKYLKKTDVSGSSDSSGTHITLDLSSWADNLSSSQRNRHAGYPEKQGNLAQQVDCETQQFPTSTKIKEKEREGEVTLANRSPSAVRLSGALSPPDRADSKRSSIPRPRSFSSAKRSSGSGQLSTHKPPADKMGSCDETSAPSTSTSGTLDGALEENAIRLGKVNPQASNISSSETSHKTDRNLTTTSPGWRKGQSGLPCLKGSSPPTQRLRNADQQQQQDRPSDFPEKKPSSRNIPVAPLPHSSVENNIGFSCQNIQPPLDPVSELHKGFSEPCVEETACNFRPSTSPLTHSSPSQTSVPSAEGVFSPSSSSGGPADRCPVLELSPQSICSSPSLSRLTYISMHDGTVVPTPERQKNNCTMALSTTIIRFSPTPPVEPDEQSNLDILGLPKSLDQVQPQHSKSLDPLPAQQSKSPEPSRSGSALSCTRSQSECNYACPGDRTGDISAGCKNHRHLSESNVRQLTKVDSGYCSNLNIQQTSNSVAPVSSQQWGTASSVASSVYAGGLGMLPSYSSEGLHYMPIPSFKPQCPGMIDLPHQGDMQSLLAGRSLFNPQLAQQYLGPEAQLHPGVYHVGATTNGLYSMSSTGIPNNDLTVRHLHPTSGPLGTSATAGSHHLPRPHQCQQEVGMMGKPYSQYGAEPMGTNGLEELRGQVVVPEELRFPHACCVGIASQTSLSLFNPSERWQQVSITVTSLAIDGEKVDSLPYQWLMVKNKTIIGPKTTEEQKVLFIPPQAGVYQCILSVCSWPAAAESEVAARANIFAKRVVLVAIAENPSLEIEVCKSGCLDFGDLPGGSAKSLPLKLLNRTHATVPIRLVISANATAWRCFTFSKHPVTMTSEGAQQPGHTTPVSSPLVMNHVMHASYGENPESFMVWVHFKAPQKYTVSSGELGPADEYSARVDIEVDSPGPSHVIRSIPLRARSGTARVHAPKDLQTVSLSAPLGKSSQQTLPLKNAGNIDVQLKLKSSDAEDSFSVTPDELFLREREEQGIVVSFKAQGNRKCRESLLTILVLPSGPQYEVMLKGEVIAEDSGKRVLPSAAAVYGPGLTNDVPPILSNKQFVAWGGVTLGRAVQQKLVLRNNSTNATQQLRLLIRGQDQDCFQLQSMFSPEERLTRHGELSIRPKEDVTVHLLFAPTRVACMLAKLEIKQSGVRPSQPGVKFTIPLSGYGGTSNIILEEQRKQADGYVATLPDIAVGRISKVCLCVRNTGSRAAFIKAVAFSDVQTRSVMEASVISLAPSQFVLKERTQEVITVLMKSTQREQSLCESANALLATVCLFCGDEVSRQQYRRLLQSKPEVVRKALSENSLLKNIDFNEKFLGEENVTETYDLPQRPNEAHIFYGNMSKVVVSLLGSAKSRDCEESEHTELLLPTARHGSETDSVSTNGNVSLDVLPVKGPQGPALRVAEPSLKASEPLHRQPESWTIHPEQLVLAAPTITGASTTSQVQIRNNTSRELNFDLSWPAHCLTITPQHGVIEPQCHLQILISPNPSLATKPALLPWSGQIYVQCDSQQKFIKVQIRRDLALDVSAAPADSTLSALPPQAATPVLSVARLSTKPLLTPQTPQGLVEISNKTIIFLTTPSGESSEAQLEVQNGEVEVRWYLSSFAPPYVKGVDNTGDVYRATYTAFRCSRVSGTMGAHEKMQVPIVFLPRDRGDYAQFWDLECHPVSEPQQKTRIRFQLCGTGVRSGPMEGPQEGDCSLVKTEAPFKTRKRAEASTGKNSQEEAVRRGVHSPQDLYTFPATRVGESSTLKVSFRNNSSDTHEITALSEATRPVQAQHCRQTRWLAAHPVRNKWKSCYSADR